MDCRDLSHHPDRASACVLPDIPDRRYGHTQDDGSLACGGLWTRRLCRGLGHGDCVNHREEILSHLLDTGRWLRDLSDGRLH